MMKFSLLSIWVFWVTAMSVMAGSRVPGDYYNKVRPERLVRNEFPIAKDYARGPLKVLMLVPAKLGGREVAELDEHLNADIETVLYDGPWLNDKLGTNNFYVTPIEGTRQEEKLKVLNGILENQSFDAIVIGYDCRYTGLSPRSQYHLLKQVKEGAALMLFGRAPLAKNQTWPKALFENAMEVDWNEALAGVPFDMLRTYKYDRGSDDFNKAYRFGEGRVLWMSNRGTMNPNVNIGSYAVTPFMKYAPEEWVYYDYHFSAFLKGLTWCVPEKAPVVKALASNPRSVQAAWSATEIKVDGGILRIPGGKSMTMSAVARDLYGQRLNLQKQELSGEAPLSFVLPSVHAGDWFIDYKLSSAAGTEYWGSLGLVVEKAEAGFGDMSLTDVPFVPREGFKCYVPMVNPSHELQLNYKAVDHNGRVIFQGVRAVNRQEAEDGELLLEADLQRAVVKVHRLELDLMKGEQLLDRVHFPFLVKQPLPRFINLIWGAGGGGIFAAYMDRTLEAAGFNMGSLAARGMLNNLDTWDYTFRVNIKEPNPKKPNATYADEGYFYQKFHGEFKRQAHDNITAQRVSKRKKHISLYNLGDENSLHYERYKYVAPEEEKDFQAMLKKTYRKIDFLNRGWGSTYKSFEEVKVPDITKLKDISDTPYRHHWMHYVERLYALTHQRALVEVRKLDPDPTKIIGAEGSHMGNPELTLKGMTMWGPYANRLDNVMMRSFGSVDLLRSNWWGGYLAQRNMGAQPLWDMVLSGAANSSFYFMDFSGEGMISRELAMADYFEETQLEGILEVMKGIGALVGQTPTKKVGLGVFFSMASDHALGLDTRFGVPGSTRDNLLYWAEKVGIPAYLYSDKTIQAGKLQEYGVKVLFFGQGLCLSSKTKRSLDKWVKDGGVIIADHRAALRDDKAEWVKSSPLNALFGVKQGQEGKPLEFDLELPLKNGSVLKMPKMVADSDVIVKDRSAKVRQDVNGTPVFIERNHGKGKAIFLNFTLGKLIANLVDAPECRAFMEELMDFGSVFTGLKVPAGYVVNRFQGHGFELLSSRMTQEGVPGEVIELGETWHVVEVRTGRDLGKVNQLTPSELADTNTLFVLRKEAAPPWKAELPSSARAGDVLRLKIHNVLAEDQAQRFIRVSFFDKVGKEDLSMRQFVDVMPDQSTVRVKVPLAYNLDAGEYSIEVHDLITAQTETLKCVLR